MLGRWLPFLHIRLLALQHLPLAALISLDTLRNALSTLGYPAVALFIMIESSGIPFPGETMLLLASFYAAVDQHLQIPLVIVCAALGAIIGDNIGYTVGRTGGYALVRRFGRFVFLKEEHPDIAHNRTGSCDGQRCLHRLVGPDAFKGRIDANAVCQGEDRCAGCLASLGEDICRTECACKLLA